MIRAIVVCSLFALAAACSSSDGVTPHADATASVTFVVARMLPSTRSVAVTLDQKLLAVRNVRATSTSLDARAPAGNDAFTLTAYDRSNGKGNVLATGVIRATLQSGATKSMHVAMTGRPASITLSLTNPYPPAGKRADIAVTVAVLDADGNTILGKYGDAVRLRDTDRSGATQLTTASLRSSQDHVWLSYDGSPLSSTVVTASMRGTSPAAVTFAPVPTVVAQYPSPWLPRPHPFPVGLYDLCIGPDGNLWLTGSSSGSIEKLSSDGKFVTYPIRGTAPVGISAGADGNVWFVEQLTGILAKITTSGVITTYAIPNASAKTPQPAWTTRGPDGRTWFVDQGLDIVGAITRGGTISEYPLPEKSFPQEIVTGPDGNLWMTDNGLNAVDVLSPSGKLLAVHRLRTPNAWPWGIAIGPDKNLWIAEYNAGRIARMTVGGQVKEFALPTALAGPLNVAAGPDGNVWFAETGGGIGIAGKIGYITTDGSFVRDFPTAGNNDHVHAIVFDAQHNLWFTEFNGPISALGKMIY